MGFNGKNKSDLQNVYSKALPHLPGRILKGFALFLDVATPQQNCLNMSSFIFCHR